ncbi:MAG: DUF2239 family protein [Rhodospirillales bacterium]|jgi:uncharacterized protein|nr:DUF2239 family protein [Rhodospirillales bacterium]
MTDILNKPTTAFIGSHHLVSGPRIEVALAIKNAREGDPAGSILAFDDATGRVVDFDLRGTKEDIIARLVQPPAPAKSSRRPAPASPPSNKAVSAPRGRGRPKLGVVAREVTLLPRHWEWLAAQPDSASVTLRRLVEEARKSNTPRQHARAAKDAAYAFMQALAGDLPGFEEATRALFADNRTGFEMQIFNWPADIRAHAIKLAYGELVKN